MQCSKRAGMETTTLPPHHMQRPSELTQTLRRTTFSSNRKHRKKRERRSTEFSQKSTMNTREKASAKGSPDHVHNGSIFIRSLEYPLVLTLVETIADRCQIPSVLSSSSWEARSTMLVTRHRLLVSNGTHVLVMHGRLRGGGRVVAHFKKQGFRVKGHWLRVPQNTAPTNSTVRVPGGHAWPQLLCTKRDPATATAATKVGPTDGP